MGKREAYLITLTRPDGAGVREMAEYIKEAVLYSGGCKPPDDPLFSWKDKGEVTVKRINT